jgi:uracil phosphoribosyltransferase
VQPVVKRKQLCFVPILRAGLGMADGLLDLLPGCTCGHIGLYRDEKTKQPVEYYCKLPADISEKDVYLVDPMLATGGSAIDAVAQLMKHGAKKITFICIIAAPEGVEAFCKRYPDIPLFIGALDRCLNENAYICPGLGDCGDRTFGTTNGTTEDRPII